MKRTVFIILSVIGALVSICMFAVVFCKDLAEMLLVKFPTLTLLPFLIAACVAALFSIICYIIQSVIKSVEWKKYQKEHPEEAHEIRQQMIAETSNSIGNYQLYQLADLRSKIFSIFGRCLVAAILNGVFQMDGVLIMYFWVSYSWFFIKLTGNYLIGIIVCIAAFIWGATKISTLPEPWGAIAAVVLILGIFIVDLVNIIRYIALRVKITKNGMKIRKLTRDEMKMYRNMEKQQLNP